MTLLSPFNVRSPVFFVELSQAGHIINNFSIRRVALGVIFLSGLDDDIDDVREAAAATAALSHGVIDLGRNDQLPTVVIEQFDDDLANFPVGDVVATADQHFSANPSNMTNDIRFLLKETRSVKKKRFSLLDVACDRLPQHDGRPDNMPASSVRPLLAPAPNGNFVPAASRPRALCHAGIPAANPRRIPPPRCPGMSRDAPPAAAGARVAG